MKINIGHVIMAFCIVLFVASAAFGAGKIDGVASYTAVASSIMTVLGTVVFSQMFPTE